VKRDVPVDKDGWLQATFRLESIEGVAIDVLSLGPQIEVLAPPELRDAVADQARGTARLYRAGEFPTPRSLQGTRQARR
jgi:predicted DNA-binding transcriptional regulator YafY